ERFPLAEMGPLTAETLHLLVEIKKRAFVDRERCADPRFAVVELEELLSKTYAARVAGELDLRRAIPRPLAVDERGGETTYFAVVDGQGNAVSGIQSLNDLFGSKTVAGDT